MVEQGANTGSMGGPSGDADGSQQFGGWGQERQGGPASTNDEEARQAGEANVANSSDEAYDTASR